jgi:hypothetical protein
LDAKVDVEVDSLYVKRINIENLVGYVYIVRVDSHKSNKKMWINLQFFNKNIPNQLDWLKVHH